VDVTRKKKSSALWFVLIGVLFLFFGFLAVAAWSELLTRTFDLGALCIVVVVTGVSVALAYPLVAKLVLRDRFAWKKEGLRAFAIFSGSVAVVMVVLDVQFLAEHGSNLSQIVTQELPSRYVYSNSIRWPAWCSVVAMFAFAAVAGFWAYWSWRLGAGLRTRSSSTR
jgi:hypothetical protein